jgi:hypothetical protein
MRFENKEVGFDLPRDWDDRSVVAFAAPEREGAAVAANVVMTRDALGAGETLGAYADRQLVELAQRLDGFELRARREFKLAGHDAIELAFGWQGEAAPLEQRMMLVANRKRVVMSFTATSARSEMQKNDAVFDRIFSSIRFSDADPG